MPFERQNIGKTYEIGEILKGVPCMRCQPCMKLRLMEMGFNPGEKIQIESHQNGLWLVNILTETGKPSAKIALRDEEMERVCVL
jgi:Fe2+ transport system protein FeoA